MWSRKSQKHSRRQTASIGKDQNLVFSYVAAERVALKFDSSLKPLLFQWRPFLVAFLFLSLNRLFPRFKMAQDGLFYFSLARNGLNCRKFACLQRYGWRLQQGRQADRC
jgi:hypothetical protein